MPSKKEVITARFDKYDPEYKVIQRVKQYLEEKRGESVSQTQIMRYILRDYAKNFIKKTFSFLIGCI